MNVTIGERPTGFSELGPARAIYFEITNAQGVLFQTIMFDPSNNKPCLATVSGSRLFTEKEADSHRDEIIRRYGLPGSEVVKRNRLVEIEELAEANNDIRNRLAAIARENA